MKKPRNLIGGQLQNIRLKKGVSQMELSAISQRKGWDISRFTIAKIESGSRCVADFELVLLAKSLEIEVADLFPKERIWLANRKHFMNRPGF
jgi:DNA-binding XRE family transcriptional regulator